MVTKPGASSTIRRRSTTLLAGSLAGLLAAPVLFGSTGGGASAGVASVAGFPQQAEPGANPDPTIARESFATTEFRGDESWTMTGGATFDPQVSATDGSGSIRLPARGAAVQSTTIATKADSLYFVRAKVRQDTWPRGNVTLSVQQVTANGGWVANLPTETLIAPFVNGEFGTSGLYFTVRADVPFVRVVFTRFGDQASSDPMWIDEVSLERAPSIRVPATPKVAFEGTQTRISAIGNWEVRRSNGTWEPWFPMCAAVNPARLSSARYRSIAAQGFNCDIWNGESVRALEMAKAAGLRSFAQIAQYTNDQGWAVGRIDSLAEAIRTVNRSPAADYLAGYFLDNENSSDDVRRTREVAEAIRANDVEGTKRRRPILQLQGNYGSLGLWSDEQGRPFSDAVGAYVPAVNSGGAGSAPGGQLFLGSQPGQREPSAYCQINDGIGVMFRAALYGCLAHGSRAVSFWGDGPVDPRYPQTPFLEQQAWWSDLPAIARELRLIAPLLREPEQTAWSASLSGDNALLPVTWGTRTMGGIGHLIVSNVSLEAQTRTVSVAGLPYGPAEVRDVFTNAKLATIAADGTFPLVVPAAGLGSGSMVLRLVPAGWEPPTTTTTPVRAKGTSAPTVTKKPAAVTKSAVTKSSSAATPKAATPTNRPSAAASAIVPLTSATTKAPVAPTPAPTTILVRSVAPEPLCRSGVRLEGESAQIPIGTVAVALDGAARVWRRSGAPSAMNWTSAITGKVQYRFRYVRAAPGPARRTMFAVSPEGGTVSKQFELPSTGGAWRTATVELDVPGAVPVVLSASFDITIDAEDLDLVDSVDVCPLGAP